MAEANRSMYTGTSPASMTEAETEAIGMFRESFGPRLRVLRPCLACGEPVDGTRCEACRLAKQRERKRNDQRPPRWRKLSIRLRERSPWCEKCFSTSDLTVDHRVPVSMGGAMYDERNLRVLCRVCNSAAMAEQRRESRGVVPRTRNPMYTAPQPSARLEETAPDA